MKVSLILLIYIFLPAIVFSQDRIILKDGRAIDCLITSIDSTHINFSMVRNNRTIHTMIEISEVSIIYLTSELTETEGGFKKPAETKPNKQTNSYNPVTHFFSGLKKPQDRILLKDGREIECTVTQVDSTTIHFTLISNNRVVKTMIDTSEVQSISVSPESQKPAGIENTSEKDDYLRRNSFFLSYGRCMPRNDFKLDDIFSEYSGYAGEGTSFHLKYRFMVTDRIGLSVSKIHNTNEYNAKNIEQAISYLIRSPVEYKTARYKTDVWLFAPSYILPIERVNLEGHAGLAYGKLKEPEVKYSFTIGDYKGWVTKNSISSRTLLFNVGGSLIFIASKNWDIFANLDYFEGSFDFGKNTISGFTGNASGIPERKQNFEVFTLTLGMGLTF